MANFDASSTGIGNIHYGFTKSTGIDTAPVIETQGMNKGAYHAQLVERYTQLLTQRDHVSYAAIRQQLHVDDTTIHQLARETRLSAK